MQQGMWAILLTKNDTSTVHVRSSLDSGKDIKGSYSRRTKLPLLQVSFLASFKKDSVVGEVRSGWNRLWPLKHMKGVRRASAHRAPAAKAAIHTLPKRNCLLQLKPELPQ